MFSSLQSPSRTAAVWSATPPMSKVKSPQLYSKDKTPQLSLVSAANGTSSATPSSIQPEVGVDERRSESCSSSPAQSRQKKKRGLERNDSYHSDGPSAEGRKVSQIIRYNIIMFQCSMTQAWCNYLCIVFTDTQMVQRLFNHLCRNYADLWFFFVLLLCLILCKQRMKLVNIAFARSPMVPIAISQTSITTLLASSVVFLVPGYQHSYIEFDSSPLLEHTMYNVIRVRIQYM